MLLRKFLSLSDKHRADQLARGLSYREIERRGYKSTPNQEQGDAIADVLSAYGLEGVPGFYFSGGRWRMLRVPPGIFVPHRDERGRIEGLQHRPDDPGGGGKYRWLSTNPELTDGRGRQRYPRGASSGAPVHHSDHHLLRDAELVTVTEGALKADVIAYLTQEPVIGVAGVSTFGRDFPERLRRSAPRARTVRAAYDRDLVEKKEVLHALKRLCVGLEGAGFAVRVLVWPGPWKGFDDYLLAQLREKGADEA